ncbi:MAG: alpha/beta fold hydrolase [Candidatus Sericytochromatia bacterium]
MLEHSEHGPADAPSVVLLHGAGASGWTWRPVVERLAGYHCLVPDLPEHGRSLAVAPFTIPDAASRLAAMIRDRAHGGRAHVVGLSLGGQVALQLAATAPERVTRLLVSGVALHPAPIAGWMRQPLGRRAVEALLNAYWPWRMAPALLRANMRGFDVPAEFAPEFAADTRAMSAEAMVRIVFDESQGFTLPRALESLSIPLLALAGEREDSIVHRSAAELIARLPAATGGIVPGVGHNWPLEAPERFVEVLTAWLTGGAPAGLTPFDDAARSAT